MKKLEAEKRTKDESTKKMRENGFIPAIVYGKDLENIMIKVPDSRVRSLWKDIRDKEKFILEIEGKEYPVVLQEMQTDVVSSHIISIDFLLVQED